MEGFWDFLKVLAIVNGALIALFLVLLALPESKVAKLFFKILGIINYVIAGLLIVYILSPIDLLPDVIPVLGQTDDAAGIIALVVDGVIGYISLKKSQQNPNDSTKKNLNS